MSYFSDKLKELRKKSNLTQRAVAEKLGISQGNYSGLEQELYSPSLPALRAISDFYDVSIDELVSPVRFVRDVSEEEMIFLKKLDRLSTKDKVEIERLVEIKLSLLSDYAQE